MRVFAKVSHECYRLSVPSLFRVCPLVLLFFVLVPQYVHNLQTVRITSAEALHQYASCVPKSYNRHIRHLTICTKRAKPQQPSGLASQPIRVTDALVDILPYCKQVEHLTLSLTASLAKAVIPCFEELSALTSLCIDHCGDEARFPLWVFSVNLCLMPYTDRRHIAAQERAAHRLHRRLRPHPAPPFARPYHPLGTACPRPRRCSTLRSGRQRR